MARFSFVARLYLLLSAALLTGVLFAQDSADFSQRSSVDAAMRPFYHGVASGDPLTDRVMIWTRVTPDTALTGEMEVFWQVALDTGFTQIINFGKTYTSEAVDYTVKVDVCGLQPATYYYYMFRALERNSIVGRTRTAPAGTNSNARFAVVSCASYEHGYFNVYREIANRNDVEAVIHLGDYIYEYEVGGYSSNISGRTYNPPNEIITLSDYRTRFSHYKLDEDLRKVHQLYPFITTWDDHEFANNSWKGGAENHTAANEGPWDTRKAGSAQAYSEWLPLRPVDSNDPLKIFRTIKYGNLLDLIVLDTRIHGRDEQDFAAAGSSGRKLLGDDQFAWFESRLSDTSSAWKIVCQQVMMASLRLLGIPVNVDQWDGYQADRNRFINYVSQNNIENVVVLTGDIHTSWANDIPKSNYNPFTGANSACVEFVTTSITSPGFPFSVPSATIQLSNPHMKYIQLTKKGYILLDINNNRTQADWNYVSTITSQNYNPESGEAWYVNSGERNVKQASAHTPSVPLAAALPPELPNQAVQMMQVEKNLALTTAQNTNIPFCYLPDSQALCPGLNTEVIMPPQYGSVEINQGTFCHSYLPDFNYAGTDSFVLTACQSSEPFLCDTIVVHIDVEGEFTTDAYSFTIAHDSAVSFCFSFDDLYGSIDTTFLNYTGSGSATFQPDTCLSYEADTLFTGVDTILYVACDNAPAPLCDTVIFYITVLPPDTLPSGIKPQEKLALLGNYPNPFSENFILQYYLHEKGEVALEIRDMSGKVVHSTVFSYDQPGLKYTRIHADALSEGVYILRLSMDGQVFRRKIVKAGGR